MIYVAKLAKGENRGWKLNNLTSVIHYSSGVSSNYSLFFFKFLLVIHYS